ncbi:MAG TPA: D-glycero-beta-D-manno-heptose 1-phosphate adenylyltransferase [Bacteroidales bacterium]|nr:D-glycero-beta-D-manno-heptose 1-phosphate adenylyltransferase [Bacteroidales bacterium]
MDHLSLIQSKILMDPTELEFSLAIWRFKEQKLVFTNGCFDIVHRGHVEYLAKAASLGDQLIIGLNTDASVKRLKGMARPVQDETTRALVLASFSFVSKVVLFDEDTPFDLISLIQPDILVKGGDYKPEDIVGYDIVKGKGGEIVTIDLVEGHSTTSIINRMNG